MRIACFIDSLGSGGAQRQLTTLAVGLKQLGHSVSFLVYHEDEFFKPTLQKAGIPVLRVDGPGKLGRALAVRRHLRLANQDVVLAFLEGPCLYAELAAWPWRRWGLIVSERLQINPPTRGRDWKRSWHSCADYVTTNAHATRRVLATMFPRLMDRLATIYNSLDLQRFRPAPDGETPSKAFRAVVAASYQERKNTIGLIRAVSLALRRLPNLRIDWYGGLPAVVNGHPDRRYLEQAQAEISQLGLQEHVHLHPAEADIIPHYHNADAVLLPSFQEGLPNTICEAMACGRPVLASRIGDAEVLVKTGVNGFLFDPASVEDMAGALVQLGTLPPTTREQMGRESRKMAEAFFDPARTIQPYVRLLEAAAARRRVEVIHWPPADLREGVLPP